VFYAALIGAGPAAHALVQASVTGLQLVGVYHDDGRAARALAKRGAVGLYSSVTELVTDSKSQVVLICTPPDSRAHLIQQSARQGKHVFCAGRLATSMRAAAAAVAACEKAGVRLMAAHPARFLPHYMRARELVRGGSIGTPGIVGTFRSSPHHVAQ